MLHCSWEQQHREFQSSEPQEKHLRQSTAYSTLQKPLHQTKWHWLLHTMYVAISSGASPSRSNLKVTILWLWVSSWHSTILSPVLHTCNKSGHIVILDSIFQHEFKEMRSLLGYILVTHIEHAELWPANLFLPRTSASGSAVVFADFGLAFTTMCSLVTVAHLLPWRGIGVDAGFGEEREVLMQVLLYSWIPAHRIHSLRGLFHAFLIKMYLQRCSVPVRGTNKQQIHTNMFRTVLLKDKCHRLTKGEWVNKCDKWKGFSKWNVRHNLESHNLLGAKDRNLELERVYPPLFVMEVLYSSVFCYACRILQQSDLSAMGDAKLHISLSRI